MDDKEGLKERKKKNITTQDGERVYTGVITYQFKDKEEKPWQRVVYGITRKGTHLYEPVKSVPSTLIILVLGTYLLLGYLTQLVEDDMPSVINDADIAREDSTTFSEEAAWKYLNQILGDQPRVAGTEYHLHKTQDMKNIVDNIAASARQTVRTDWQLVTGSFWMNIAFPFVNYYQNLSNVVAVLEGESGFHSNGTIGSSILVNCHYDSVPFALGASDNVVFCAAMAETLSKLSRRTQKFKHNIIFLFNGAEENPLQASHGFISHPWFSGVSVVVNLDAAGMNGKPAVFQVTDPRALSAYKRRVSRPNAQSFGEFLFTSGIIPSDTDFRIWRYFGRLNGIDIAFSKFGHVYHTRFDHPDLIQTGVIQNAGSMVIGLVSELADNEDMANKVTPESSVYFDYLNTFMIWYPLRAAYAVDVLVALFGLVSVAYFVWLVGLRWSTVSELLLTASSRGAALIAGAIITFIFLSIMIATTIQMRYLTQPWLVVPVFWMPYVITAVCVSHLYDRWRVKRTGLNRCIRTLQAMAATRFLLSVCLLIMSCVPKLTPVRYGVTVPLFIMSLTACVTLTVVRYWKLAAWQHLILEIVLSLPVVMFVLTTVLRLNAVLLPVMGRSAIDNPDNIVAVVNLAFAILLCSTVSGIELLFSRRRMWISIGLVSVACIVLMFIPFSPYNEDVPSTQRHYWFHTEIKSYDINRQITERTTGLLVTKHDPYSTERVLPYLKDRGYNFNSRTDFSEDCEKFVYCNLPLYRTSFGRYLKHGLFVYTNGPAEFSPPAGLTSARSCQGELCTYVFTITPAPHNLLTFWPREGANLTSWSLTPAPQPSFTQLGRPVYVIVHSIATYSDTVQPLVITANFIVPLSLQSSPVVDVSHHAHLIHHPESFTSHYTALINAMPKYFNFAHFLTFRNNYVF
ncbi:endoplasmic reticulum metallopeptidase 1-like isoform X2 [Plodia interpunctella]|uniref:endoplasmic reticulum metallopeptidase 1-like isoform X2 n=1 Tax=Plodia interpunctella TaxID=58824 RepID=UPI002367D23D|nr:endoplasmic reticulum metallopeptidase 1-like isoform X2 [Plodia interpunctella]